MRAFLAAISMLSIIPVGKFVPGEKDLRKMVDYYPWAGLVFAVIFWGFAYLAAYLPVLVGAMLLTIFPEALTKGFHLDGLADTADAFLSGRSRERKLEIMRDSHIGTMGVLAIVAVLGLKFVCFASMPKEIFPAACALMVLSGRCSIVWYIAMSRYARTEGLGQFSFAKKPYWGSLSGGILCILFCSCFLNSIAILIPLLLFFTMFLWSRISKNIIGGATGDTIGCAEEIAETVTVIFLLVLQGSVPV